MNDSKLREKCLKEVKLMQPLRHENIIQYIDSFIFNNELFIVTEWAEMGDLKRLIRSAIDVRAFIFCFDFLFKRMDEDLKN